ncbi:putative membrane protein [Caldisphaera lagunensis DSM 15908]|uniref:Putative membrane protein n=1 Tax=Caldisphaera lagunensis (strain DSM 15908 / JCM 11604 / ANMR 0165 / IC-154) TaxID=1056495 RepID=L0A7N6_CALLD|nr:DUF998 domain-containing protein [Caldisphaera lagunensis]AFZ69883.1 putative membrane protein [Caldisphaera lagunensis DSM 15908]
MNKRTIKKLIILFSILAILSSWVTIFTSISFNPWFKINKNAFSDLGGGSYINGHPPPMFPFIYNVGMIITGSLIFIFSIFIAFYSRNVIEAIGGSYFSLSGIFLILIGIYHEGTYPHIFVSLWFFILASISIFILGISLIKIYRNRGLFLTIFPILAWIFSYFIPFSSTAETELYGILAIEISVLLYISTLWIKLILK